MTSLGRAPLPKMAATVPKQRGTVPCLEKALLAKSGLGLEDVFARHSGRVADYVFWKRGWERLAFDENGQHDGL